jgi:FkbM family methyltransferase
MSLSHYIARGARRLHRDALRVVGRDALTRRRIHTRPDLVRLGSRYGGWIVPLTALDSSSVCYCAGVGEDISFDLALIERFDCEVHAFDPTPRAIAHVAKVAAGHSRFHFEPVGLWERDERLRFYAPADPSHVSHSVVNLQNSAAYFEAPCHSLDSLMRARGHDRIDLLKLDIEGAEHRVIASMLADDIAATVLCVEFDEASLGLTDERRSRIAATVDTLVAHGYELVAQDGRANYTFVRR